MKYFIDTEFVEDGKIISLISIALVCEDGRECYYISNEFDFLKAWVNDFVRENVLLPIYQEHMLSSGADFSLGRLIDVVRKVGISRVEIAENISQFLAYEAISNDHKEATKYAEQCYAECEFWAYYAAYDWVVFCQLFGKMIDFPRGLPMHCNDIKQLCDYLGNPELPKQVSGEHNALADAKHNQVMYQYLKSHVLNQK